MKCIHIDPYKQDLAYGSCIFAMEVYTCMYIFLHVIFDSCSKCPFLLSLQDSCTISCKTCKTILPWNYSTFYTIFYSTTVHSDNENTKYVHGFVETTLGLIHVCNTLYRLVNHGLAIHAVTLTLAGLKQARTSMLQSAKHRELLRLAFLFLLYSYS